MFLKRKGSLMQKTVAIAVAALCVMMGSGTAFGGQWLNGTNPQRVIANPTPTLVGIGLTWPNEYPQAWLHVKDTTTSAGQKIVFLGTTKVANSFAAIKLGDNTLGNARAVVLATR
jgi:hypothetical protein